ncbi:hypothetical protein [Paenibacillus sp. NPDC093718]|uniref:hypothetical protein n=1 Tax=Paenibacillus sp. NPDC093718 TaxID=3390601 RepID=UPI003D01571D
MDVFITQNNRASVIQLPVPPQEFNVSLEQNHGVFNTISQGDLRLIDFTGLKKISFSSFFPFSKDTNAPFIKSKEWFGYSYTSIFERLMERRMPVRLIITETRINLPMTIDRFEYKVGRPDGIDYTMELTEFRFVNVKGVPKI